MVMDFDRLRHLHRHKDVLTGSGPIDSEDCGLVMGEVVAAPKDRPSPGKPEPDGDLFDAILRNPEAGASLPDTIERVCIDTERRGFWCAAYLAFHKKDPLVYGKPIPNEFLAKMADAALAEFDRRFKV